MGVARRIVADPRAPLVALALIVAMSFGARIYHLSLPCNAPCKTPASHTLIFDEAYYVNAARVIDGINPPAGATYHDAPKGKDPNAEHPQLAKVIIAGTIKLFGDDPWGWRGGSILFGLIALVAMFAVVTAAGGGRWLGVGAAALMSLDNLLVVHGRIGTLDIYALALMLVAMWLYLRGSPWLAGIALAIGALTKEVAFYLVFAFVLMELVVAIRGDWARFRTRLLDCTRPVVITTGVALVGFLLGLWLLDVLVPAYDTGTHITYAGSPLTHLSHIIDYAGLLKSTPYSTGISSSPGQWLVDQQPIDYARVAVNSLSAGKIIASRPVVLFWGEMNPFIIFVALPALATAAVAAVRDLERVALVGSAWCIGVFTPYVVQADVQHRISYLYYMVIVMPGIYIVVARLFSGRRVPLAATLCWVGTLIYGFTLLYPIRTL